MDYLKWIEKQQNAMRQENEEYGILFPFLHRISDKKMLVARLIRTKRDDSLNVCWACLSTNLSNNGIFFSANDQEHEASGVFVFEHLVRVSNINLEFTPDGFPTLIFTPTLDDMKSVWMCNNAIFLRDKRDLKG